MKKLSDLSMFELCQTTGIIEAICDHCLGRDDLKVEQVEEEPYSEYEVTSVFRSQFSGYCRVDPDHTIRRADLVGKLRLSDNPFIPVSGVCCKSCVKMLPRAAR